MGEYSGASAMLVRIASSDGVVAMENACINQFNLHCMHLTVGVECKCTIADRGVGKKLKNLGGIVSYSLGGPFAHVPIR